MAELVKSERVDGPEGTRVQVLFYDDRSMRFRIYESPLVIEEAFLTGNKQDHSIIKVAPAGTTLTASNGGSAAEQSAELGEAKELLEGFLSRFSWIKDHPDYFEDVKTFLGK